MYGEAALLVCHIHVRAGKCDVGRCDDASLRVAFNERRTFWVADIKDLYRVGGVIADIDVFASGRYRVGSTTGRVRTSKNRLCGIAGVNNAQKAIGSTRAILGHVDILARNRKIVGVVYIHPADKSRRGRGAHINDDKPRRGVADNVGKTAGDDDTVRR